MGFKSGPLILTLAFSRWENKDFKESFFVGDTKADGIAARENNLNFIKANYGYGYLQDWSNIPIYADINDIIYVDYFSKMVNKTMGMKKELAKDGIHPNKSGYSIMEKILSKEIPKILK